MKSICLHPSIEKSIIEWFDNRTTPAVFLVGPPGVGKTTMAYRVMQEKNLRISEFNASHTRSGACFRKVILPLLEQGGVTQMMMTGKKGGIGVILDEIDGLSTGEKGGLQTLLTYLRDWKPSNPGTPVIFISNSIQQRKIQMISRYCLTFKVGMADTDQVSKLIGDSVPDKWIKSEGDLRPLLRGEFSGGQIEDEDIVEIPDGVVPLAKWCLYSEMDPFLSIELDNNDGNLAGLVIVENLLERLEGVKGDTREMWDYYLKLYNCIQASDYADYWAFFYQTWRLLALSQDIKLNTMNLFLTKDIPWRKEEPTIDKIKYTTVLTKQSALFNAWKLLCKIGDTSNIPIRLTPYLLSSTVKAEKQGVAKKDTKKKKIESMMLAQIWEAKN